MTTSPAPSDSLKITAKVINGGLAGVIGVSLSFPLDTAKTRLQNQTILPGEKPKFTGLATAIQYLHKNGGIKTLYAGYAANIGLIVFEKAIKLAINDVMRDKMTNKETGKIAIHCEILAGMSAGFSQTIITTPMELLKIKGQQKGQPLGESLRKIMANEGVVGFYRGWGSTLVRELPFACLYFPLYGNLRNTDLFQHGKSFAGNLAAGLIAGMIGGGAVTPFDVVKTRLQTSSASDKRQTWMQCARSVYVEGNGFKPFFKGAGPRMICIGVLMSICQGIYELQVGEKLLGMV